MKKFLSAFIIVGLLMVSSCGKDVLSEESTVKTPETAVEETAPRKQYVGNYSVEPVYQEIMKFEECTDPEIMCQMLLELYGTEFTYVKLTQKVGGNTDQAFFEEPYQDFICASFALYHTAHPLCSAPIYSDTYLFFEEYNEKPLFMMDSKGTYLVKNYKVNTFDDGTHAHEVDGMIISDLFMCLHKYIDSDEEDKEFISGGVQYMDFYLDFENLIIESLGTNTGSITKTESLNK